MSIYLGTGPTGTVELPLASFLRHAVCLGSSGSGKTVACKVLCEEFVRAGVPIIAVDPQGDIASLGLPANGATVVEKGLPASMLEEYQRKAEVVIWTPASSTGVPLSVNPLGGLGRGTGEGEERIRSLSARASNVAAMLGYDLASDDGRCVEGFLHLVFDRIDRDAADVRTFGRLAAYLAEQPDDLAARTGPILADRQQEQLRRKIQLLSIGASQLLFQMGVPLSIPTLLGLDRGVDDGRTRVSVIYLNTLHSQAEKEFLLAQLAGSLYEWMLDHPAEKPQALLYIDEVAPFLPPVAKPACKDALTLLFKQARKYGIACLLASQNPGDIDYRCLAQFSTWNLGRMMVRQDIKKVSHSIKSIAGDETDAILDSLPNLSPGQFRLLAPDSFDRAVEVRVRWLLTEHRTLDEDSIAGAMDADLRARLMKLVEAPPPPEPAPDAPGDGAAPAPTASVCATEERSPADLVEEFLVHSRRAWSVKDLTAEVALSEGVVRKALKDLEESRPKRITKEKAGRSNVHWARRYTFFPDHGIVEPVQVAGLQVFERDAMVAATAATSSLLGLVKKDLAEAVFGHRPLWQIQLTVSISKGILFWKQVHRRGEYLYFHPRTGDLLLATPGGIQFVSIVDKDPADIRDLDDVCRFEEKTPDEVGLDRRTLKPLLTEKEVREIAERKFPIQVEHCRLAFLPTWRFDLAGENRTIEIDGVLGLPFVY